MIFAMKTIFILFGFQTNSHCEICFYRAIPEVKIAILTAIPLIGNVNKPHFFSSVLIVSVGLLLTHIHDWPRLATTEFWSSFSYDIKLEIGLWDTVVHSRLARTVNRLWVN